MEIIDINTEFIKLDQLLKWAGAVDNGAEAKEVIKQGMVKVNNEIEIRRGRKIRHDDIIELNGSFIKVNQIKS